MEERNEARVLTVVMYRRDLLNSAALGRPWREIERSPDSCRGSAVLK